MWNMVKPNTISKPQKKILPFHKSDDCMGPA